MKQLRLKADVAGDRVDAFVARACAELSRAYARRLAEEGKITVGGRTARPAQRLNEGDEVLIDVPAPVAIELETDLLPLTVIYEDADVLVIDKPAGMPVHPSAGHERGTLVNVLLAHYPDIGPLQGELRPGIVHRLDKDTSGVIMVARNSEAQASLAAQIKEREVEKVYLAIAVGSVDPPAGIIDAPIDRDPRRRQRQSVVEGGRPARTHYRVLQQAREAALVEVRLETGRTHQIRVHMSAIGFAILGDRVYGRRSDVITRQALHAWRLSFSQPRSGEAIDVQADPPQDFLDALTGLGLSLQAQA